MSERAPRPDPRAHRVTTRRMGFQPTIDTTPMYRDNDLTMAARIDTSITRDYDLVFGQ